MIDKVVSAHQPNFLPWSGYFYKIACSDIFVFLDDVQFTKGSYINRCQVQNQGRPVRLSLPVSNVGHLESIQHKIVHPCKVARKHLRTIEQAYARSPFRDEVLALLAPHYESAEISIGAFNIGIVKSILNYLDVRTELKLQTDLEVQANNHTLLIQLARSVSATCYLAGQGAHKYTSPQDETRYADAGVDLVYLAFDPPQYEQGISTFVPNCSIIDALCWLGSGAREMLLPQSNPPWKTAVRNGQSNAQK